MLGAAPPDAAGSAPPPMSRPYVVPQRRQQATQPQYEHVEYQQQVQGALLADPRCWGSTGAPSCAPSWASMSGLSPESLSPCSGPRPPLPPCGRGLTPGGWSPEEQDAMVCKLLLPNHVAGGIIGEHGTVIRELEMQTYAKLRMSPKGAFFPCTRERICVATGTFPAVRDCIHALMDRLHSPRQNGKEFSKPKVMTRLAVPRTSVSALMGRNGANMKAMWNRADCVITVSPQAEGFNERIVGISGALDNSKRAVTEVLSKIYAETPRQEMSTEIEYEVDLPPDAWDSQRGGEPRNEDRLLIRPEDVGRYEKRELIEYLLDAAPRKIVSQYNLLGQLKNVIKSKSTAELKQAVQDTWDWRWQGYSKEEVDEIVSAQYEMCEPAKPKAVPLKPGLVTSEPLKPGLVAHPQPPQPGPAEPAAGLASSSSLAQAQASTAAAFAPPPPQEADTSGGRELAVAPAGLQDAEGTDLGDALESAAPPPGAATLAAPAAPTREDPAAAEPLLPAAVAALVSQTIFRPPSPPWEQQPQPPPQPAEAEPPRPVGAGALGAPAQGAAEEAGGPPPSPERLGAGEVLGLPWWQALVQWFAGPDAACPAAAPQQRRACKCKCGLLGIEL